MAGHVGNPSRASEDGSTQPPASLDSTSHGAISSMISPHYDVSKDVILRLEFLTASQLKAVVLLIWGAVLVGLGLLAVGLNLKLRNDGDDFMQDTTIPVVHTAFGSFLLAGATFTWVVYVRRLAHVNGSGRRWSARRKKGTILTVAELTVQLVNLVFFLLPNAYVLARSCGWFDSTVLWSGAVRWTCWNTIFLNFWVQAHNSQPATSPTLLRRINRVDAAIMDAPLWAHWPKLGLWVAFEAVLLALTGYLQRQDLAPRSYQPPGTQGDCRHWVYDCEFDGPALALLITLQALMVVYAVAYLLTARRNFQMLAERPYMQFRMANLNVRLSVRLRTLAYLFFILCTVVYLFVRIGTCSSYVSSWLGFLPMQASSDKSLPWVRGAQFVMTCIACSGAFIHMPKKPHHKAIMQVWLQEFAWTENDVPRKRQERASNLPQDCPERVSIDYEPMFCFETAVKLMYWSYLVYDHDETKGSPFSVDTALSLYDLEHFELFWEKALDTKAIMGWNDSTVRKDAEPEPQVVVAFRGTASLANVRSDLEVWRTPYPAGVGSLLLGTRPMVHAGFHRAWSANKFSEELLGRLEKVLHHCSKQQSEAGGGKGVTVYVTGHSLGAALATLCAFDIKQRSSIPAHDIKVYTFGAPRTGNHAYARLYNASLPDTWHVINNDDVVTRGGKFFVLYKRAGQRVLINRRGDMVVRPSFVEASIRQAPGGGSIRDHLLTSYQKAMVAVVLAQFGAKSFHDGKAGVMSLAAVEGTRAALKVAGLAVDELTCSGISVQSSAAANSKSGSGKWRRLLLSTRRRNSSSSSTTTTTTSSTGGSSPGGHAIVRNVSEGLDAVVVMEDTGVVASASPAATTESQEVAAARPEEEAGIVQRRCSCTQREPKANTICSLMEQATTVPAAMPCRAAANPMADPSVGSARGAGKQGIGEVPQAPLQQQHQQEPGAVQLGLGVDLDFGMVPQSDASLTLPELPLTSTRGPVAEQPQFHLVLPPIPTARRDLGELEAVPEEEESAVSAREGVNSAPAGDGRRERTRHQEQR
ncbi:hypothetical protein N2152v2_004775 [Parachlorella kessleri]